MEQVRQEEAEPVREEVSVEAAAVVVGWEVPVPALDLAGNASALIVGHAYHIRQESPAITGTALNVVQRWKEVKNPRR
jgi:hypothetical protein